MRSSSTEPRAPGTPSRGFWPQGGGAWVRLGLVVLLGAGALAAPAVGVTGAIYTDSETASFDVVPSVSAAPTPTATAMTSPSTATATATATATTTTTDQSVATGQPASTAAATVPTGTPALAARPAPTAPSGGPLVPAHRHHHR